MKKLVLCAVVVSVFPVLALAQGGSAPALPPEVKKTVDAFVGSWTFAGVVTGIPGVKEPIKLKETFVCRKGAGGRAVSCHGKANVPGLGPMEDEALVTWDVEGKVLRFVGMSSTGEVHDHRCTWKNDKMLTCEPLSVMAQGQPATVDLTVTWTDAKNMSLNETTTMKDGSKMAFEGAGSRK